MQKSKSSTKNKYDVYRMDENDRMLFHHLNISGGTIKSLGSDIIATLFLEGVDEYRWVNETIFEYNYIIPDDELIDILGKKQFNELDEDELNEIRYNYEYLEFVKSDDDELITLTNIFRYDVTIQNDEISDICDRSHSNIFDHSIVQGSKNAVRYE